MRELETVVVNKDIPEHGIERGDIGVIVHAYEDNSAVEDEFVSGEGTTLGVITLLSQDVPELHTA